MNNFLVNIRKLKQKLKNKKINTDDQLFIFEISSKIDEINCLIEDYLNDNSKVDNKKILEDIEFFEKIKPIVCVMYLIS